MPVSHIWFLRGVPSRIALILGITASSIEKVIYFAGYIVTKVHESERARVLRELDTEFKTRFKDLQNEDARDALKTRMEDMKKEKGQEPIRPNPIAVQKPGGVRTIKGGAMNYSSI